MDIPPAFFHKQASYSNVVKSPNPGSLELRQILREELKSMFSDPVFLEAQSKALASELKREIEELKQQVKERDAAIASLRAKVDDLEQYTRRNSVRIMGIPETSNEDADKITIAIAKKIGAEIDIDQIDRSHRVGLKKDGGARPIIVKFTSYRAKAELTSNRRKLATVSADKLFPSLNWPLRPAGWNKDRPFVHRVFINDDLTKARAAAAARARSLKKAGKIKDVWLRGGTVCVKCNDDKILSVTNIEDLGVFNS